MLPDTILANSFITLITQPYYLQKNNISSPHYTIYDVGGKRL